MIAGLGAPSQPGRTFQQTRNAHRFASLVKCPCPIWTKLHTRKATNMETNTLLTPSLIRPQTSHAPDPDVIVHGTGRSFVQQINAGNHWFQADEPVSFGGANSAPDP